MRLHPLASVAGAAVALCAVAGIPVAAASPATAPASAPPAGLTAASASRPAAAPPGFASRSTTWLDPAHGFLLGTAPCGDATCTEVVGTTDGGTSWQLLGRVHAPISSDGSRRPGVGEVRFSDARHGWADAPLLRHTSDGGRTWTSEPIPGGGGQVLALDTDTAGTWAVVSPCAWQHSGACRQSPLSLWRTTTASGTTWKRVAAALPYNYAAGVSAYGPVVYVTDPQLQAGGPDVLLVSTDGRSFRARTGPCDHSQDLALVQVVATSATKAALLCDGDPGFSKAVKIVYTTRDNAKTFQNRGQMGLYGIQAQLAASRSGNLAVASWSDGSFIYCNDTDDMTWQMPVGLGDGGLGWNDIVFVTDTEAYVVYSPAGSFESKGRLWVSHDAGESWSDVSP